MINLKKALSVMVASALLASSFVPAFAASNFAYEAQARTLYELGLFKGVSQDPNVFEPALGDNLDRQSGIILMLRLVGKIDTANAMSDADVASALSKYTDANKLQDWAKKPVAYAIKNGLVKGTSDTTISPEEKFAGKMYAGLVLRNIGYEVTAENYDRSSYTLAEKGGLTNAQAATFNEKDLIRDDAVGMSYGSLKAKYAVTAKTIIETLVADKKVDEAKAIAAGLITATAPVISEVNAIGAKKLEVKFPAAVDTTKATITVNKGTIGVNTTKVTFAEDKKSAVIELAAKLTKGDYTVNVAGLTQTALTAKTTVEDEKVAKIEFTSNNAVLDKNDSKIVTVSYKVSNQYSEDITSFADVQFSSGSGNVAPSNGTLTITSTSEFRRDDKVYVTAYNVNTTTYANATLTVVDKAQVADVKILGLYNADNKELDVNSDFSQFKLIVEAVDQYGNKIPYNQIKDGVVVSVANTSIVNVGNFAEETIDGVKKVVLPLVAPATTDDGTAKITIFSITTGKSASIDITVKDAAKPDSIQLQTPEFAVAGEKFEVPFTAIDQYGKEITDASKGLTTIKPSFSDSRVTGEFTQDYVKGTPVLTVDASALTEAKTVFMTMISATNKPVQLALNIVAPAKATIVSGTDDFGTKLLKGDVAELEDENVVVQDQYGREMDTTSASFKANYRIDLSVPADSKILTVGEKTYLDQTNSVITLTAADKGTTQVTLKVYDKVAKKDVAGSEYQFTMGVVEKADIKSYELADIAKIYIDAAHAKEVKVNGVLADGSKVVIPAENYIVKTPSSVAGFKYEGGKLVAANTFDFGDKDEKTVTVVVTVNGNNDTVVLTKTVTVTKVAPEATTLELQTKGVATKEESDVVSVALANAKNLDTIAADAIKVKDQYGVVIATVDYITVTATNLPEGKDLNTITKGDSYKLTAITDNGQKIMFKVVVTE